MFARAATPSDHHDPGHVSRIHRIGPATQASGAPRSVRPVTTDPAHWFEGIADHLGPAYLRYSFTQGTANEVAFLIEELALRPGMRVLDVGCGPGRHAHALAREGMEVVGVDISQTFIDLAIAAEVQNTRFVRGDATRLDELDLGRFDAAISLCQGAFGLSGAPCSGESPLDLDGSVLRGMAGALDPAVGRLAVSAFSAYFQVRFLEDFDTFDADTGVNHEKATVRDAGGVAVERDLWTTCFTPRELRLLCSSVGLEVSSIYSVTPGRYGRRQASLDEPEFLVIAGPCRR